MEREVRILANDRLAAQRRAQIRHELKMGIGQERWDVPPMGKRQDSTQWQKSEKYQRYIHSPEWKALRLAVIEERGGKCERCSSASNLHVHHKTYARFGRERREDLQVLCDICHEKEHDVMRTNSRTWQVFKPERVSLEPARQVPIEEYLARKSVA